MVTSFEIELVASSLNDRAAVERRLAPVLDELAAMGGHLVAAPPAAPAAGPGEGAGAAVIAVASGGTEAQIIERWRACGATDPGAPLTLVTVPYQNSLPAALEALAAVQQEGGRGEIVHLSGPEDAPALARLAARVVDLDVRRRLRARRIGLLGQPSDWLVASSPSIDTVRDAWGPMVVPLDIAAVVEAYRALPHGGGSRLAELLHGGAHRSVEPDAAAVHGAARLHPALRTVIDDARLDAVAVRCFDLIGALSTSGCVALAQLNDEGVVAGCEGDLVSTIAMLWTRELLDTPTWMANPIHVDPDAGDLTLAHCTIARSLTTSYELRSHFESGLGVGIAADLEAGPVTLVRLGGKDLRQAWIVDGDARPIARSEDACRTQLIVRLPGSEIDALLKRPLGNHVVLVPGHHGPRLRRWWEAMVAPV